MIGLIIRKIKIIINHILSGNWDQLYKIIVKAIRSFLNMILLPLGLILCILIRVIRPIFLVRIHILGSERLGHFAANTELYLCEIDAGINRPKGAYIDLWYNNWPLSNKQLARMIRRKLNVLPAWLLAPISIVNSWIPGGEVHRIGDNSCFDRDIHGLLDKFPAHFEFTKKEEQKGIDGLAALGIEPGASFVCLNVRDDSYLKKALPWWNWSYHDYRNCDIQNYALAAEELAKRGYYVIRMGAQVKDAINVTHPKIIDYAAKGLRTDFMDIYLGAKCLFAISNGTGFDAIPFSFRRPIVYVDHVPLGIIATFSDKFLVTTKKHFSREKKRFLTIREIFEFNTGYGMSSNKDKVLGKDLDMSESTVKGVSSILIVPPSSKPFMADLYESSPEEVAAVILEMEARLKGTWIPDPEDEELQKRFWKVFQIDDNGFKMHGEIRSRIGADFLRKNKALLE